MKYLICLMLSFLLFFSSLFFYMDNMANHDKLFEKHGVYERFSREQALNAMQNILGFFKSKNELDKAFFNQREISHLNDVKILITRTKPFYYSLIVLLILTLLVNYLKKDFVHFFSTMLIHSALINISLISILALLYLTAGFDFLFLKFHELFFVENYSFDPRISNLKALFPDSYFLDIAHKIILLTLFKSLVMIVVGCAIRKKSSANLFKGS